MRREEALGLIRQYKNELALKFGVTRIGVFGSTARDDAKGDSDVDVVVELSKPDLFLMVHIKSLLERVLRHRVDIVRYRMRMNGLLKERIDREAVYA